MDKLRASLPDRLKFVLAGRKPYPWAKAIGISSGSVDAMLTKGGMPGAETLRAIGRTENVRMDWLVEGRGTPYYVSVLATDDDAAESLQNLIDDERWEVTVVWDGKRCALVLSQPGGFKVKDRLIEHKIIEVICGAIGIRTIQLVRKGWKTLGLIPAVYLAKAEPTALDRITAGEVGTYGLFDAPDALLAQRSPFDQIDKFGADIARGGAAHATPEEASLLDRYRAMSPANRLAVNQVVSAIVSDPEEKGS